MDVKLPDQVYEKLRVLLDNKETLQWEIGDFIVEVWAEFEKYSLVDDRRKEHARFLKDIAENTGSHYGSLRNMERMAEFYTRESRDRWCPPLTWSHLRACLSAGDDWETWASFAVDNGFNGKPASADAIRDARRGVQSKEEIATRLLGEIRKKAVRLLEISEGNQWALMITAIVDDALGEDDGKE